MNSTSPRQSLSRRALLTGGAGLTGAVVIGSRYAASPVATSRFRTVAGRPSKEVHLVGTDGWVSMPAGAPADPPFYPDPLAPGSFDTYVFGFRDVTGLTAAQVAAQRGRAQISAPVLAFDEEDDIYITLTNLGLVQRPDLFDGHTLHWHGFVNAIPLFDGVPELSMAVPIGRDFTYFYRPHDAGTYMYHCHFEDVEHVQMGMTGVVYVRPKQNSGQFGQPAGTYAYNDGDGSTRYDREFTFMLTELWSAAHFRDAHIQVSDWTDFDPSFWLLNGRGYPDTLAPNGDPRSAAAGRLQYQPISSLVHCNTDPHNTFSLTARDGYATTPDGNSIYMWSYADSTGDFQLPGPVLCVTSGEHVTVTLLNTLPEPTSITFPGQQHVTADGKPAQPQPNDAGALTSMVQAADTPDASGSPGSVTYEFDAGSPGTYLYSSGTDTDEQLQMGLYGALVVRPAGHPDQVNDRADSAFNPDHEYLFLLSEVDPDLHLAVERGEPVDQNSYNARYFMINGRSMPDTLAPNNATWLPSQPYGAMVHIQPYDAQTNPRPALIRYLDAGSVSYPFHPHGSDERVVNVDGHALEGPNGEDLSYNKFDLNVLPGQSLDALMDWRDVRTGTPPRIRSPWRSRRCRTRAFPAPTRGSARAWTTATGNVVGPHRSRTPAGRAPSSRPRPSSTRAPTPSPGPASTCSPSTAPSTAPPRRSTD